MNNPFFTFLVEKRLKAYPGSLVRSFLIIITMISCIVNNAIGYTNALRVTMCPSLIPGSIAGNQTICYGDNPPALTGSSASGGDGNYSYQWQFRLAGSGPWIDLFIGGDGTSFDPYDSFESRDYRRRVVSCGETKYSNIITVTVHPSLSPGSITGTQSICSGGNPSILAGSNASGGTGSYSYQWQERPVGGSWSNITGATGTSFDPSNLTSSMEYRRRVISCGKTKYSNVAIVTVHPHQLVGGSINGTQTICYNNNPSVLGNVSSAGGGTGSYSYQWQERPVGGSWVNITGATGTSFDPSNLTSSMEYRRRVVSCNDTKYSNTITVTVHSSLTPGSIAGSQTICYGDNPPALTGSSASGGDGNYSYQWQYRLAGGGSWIDLLIGGDGTGFDPYDSFESRDYRRRVVSCGETRYSNIITVTVHPSLSPGSITGTQSICSGGNPSILSGSNASGGTGSYSYQWQERPVGGSWSNITGATGASFDPSNLTSSMEYRRRVVSCGDTKYSNTVAVTVHPSLIPGSITGVQSICYGDNPPALTGSSASGGTGSYSYQWQERPVGGSWVNITGATGASFDPSNLTSSMEYRRRVVSCNDTKYSNTITVTVHSSLTPGSIAGSQTICYGDNPPALTGSSASGGDGNYSYQWQYRLAGGGSWIDLLIGGDGTGFDPYDSFESRDYRRRVVSCGETRYSNIITVTVHPSLSPGSITGTQSICSGGNPSILSGSNASGGTGSYSYQWQERPVGGSWVNITGATGASFDPSNLTSSMEYRRRVVSCGDTKYSNTVAVTVHPSLIPGSITGVQSICYGGNPSILSGSSASGGTGSYSYQWQERPVGGSWVNITGATGASFDPSNLTSSMEYRRRVVSCNDTKYSNTITVTVHSSLTPGSIAGSQTICYGDNPPALTGSSASGGDGNYSYQWQYRLAGGGSWIDLLIGGDGTGFDPYDSFESRDYRRRVVSCGETRYSNIITVTVHSSLSPGSIAGSQTICYGDNPPALTGSSASGGMGSYSYQWQYRLAGGGSWIDLLIGGDGTGFDPYDSFESRDYRRRVVSCGETRYSNIITVTVHPSLVPGNITGVQSICYGGNPSILSGSSASGGTGSYSYQWQGRPLGGSWVNITGATGASFDPSNLTSSMEYRRRVVSCGETKYSNTITITVHPSLVPGSIAGSQSIHPNQQPFPLTSLADGVYSGSYQWQYATDSVHFTNIAGATSAYYQPPAGLATTTWYRRNIIIDCGTESTNMVKVTIIPSTGSSRITPGTDTGPVSPTVPIHSTPAAYANDSKVNHVRTWEVLKPGITEAQLATAPNRDVQMATQYMDGLGRPIQTVARGSSPEGHDLVATVLYDAYGRVVHQYLPYRSSGNDGAFKNDPFHQQKNFYDAHFGGQEAVYYSHTQYDGSPLNRAIKQTAPGNSWTGNDVGVATDWQVNTIEDDIKNWTVGVAGAPALSGIYPTGELMATLTTDEEGNQVKEYTDKTGQVILKRIQHTGTALGHADWLNTYYLYDDYGNLRFVLPPKAVELLYRDNWDWATASIEALVFVYTYDGRNRMVTKQTPGAGRVDMVYDKLDRLVLTQDANQRSADQWVFTKYDDLNRPVITGFYTSDRIRDSLQTTLDAWTGSFGVQSDQSAATAPYEGYTDATFPTLGADTEPLTVNYYDDYRFTGSTWGSDYPTDLEDTVNHGIPPQPYANATGLSTGSKVKVLGTDQWLATVLYYDDRARPVQTQGDNHQGGKDITTTQYDFSGKTLKTYTQHTNPQASNTTSILKQFTYDHAGRLLSIEEKLNDTGEFKTIVTNTYNALGELESKTLDNGLETLNYAYNIRGWLKSINGDYVAGNTNAHYFGMALSYDWGFTNSQLNGNIAGIQWKTSASDETKAYGFGYDRLNRLTKADYGEGVGWGNTANDFSVNHLSYDANGNILTLQRKGKDMSGGIVTIDDLNYHYLNHSNQLARVDDAYGDAGQDDFKDGNTSADDYTYDANGNMSQDRNKEITGASAITYNHLNLPETVTFTGNRSITYTYDAAGIKLQKTVNDNGAITTTDYMGSFIYEEGQLQQFAHEEGRVRQYGDRLVYDYYIKDHLGNTRLTLAGSPDTITYLATMESEYATFEESMFVGIPATREVHLAANHTVDTKIHANEAAGLNGSDPNRRIGPGKVLQVTPGDQVTIEVQAYYENNLPTGSSTLGQAAIVTALAGAFGGLNGGSAEQQAIYDLFDGHAASIAVAGNAPHPGQPKAYLNYLRFDQDFNYVDAGFVQVSAAAQASHEKLSIRVDIDQGGYLYTYLSNESGADLHVYFDDLKIDHIQGIVLQEDHYYPFGMNIKALSFQRPAATAKMETVTQTTQASEEILFQDYEGSGIYTQESGEVLIEDGRLQIADTDNGTYEAGSSSITLTTVAGEDYEMYFEIEPTLLSTRGEGEPAASLYIDGQHIAGHTDGVYARTFTATGTTTTILFQNTGGSSEGLVATYLDNLTVTRHYTKTDTLERMVHTGEMTGLGNRFKYNGNEEQTDFDLNLYDFNARFYDPQLGRFIHVDPLADHPQQIGISPYAAFNNNPVLYVDPDGRIPIIPLLLKAGTNAAADWFAQTAMNYYFNPETSGNWSASAGDVNGWQIARSGVEGLIPWKTPGGRLGRAALTATGDVTVNYLNDMSGYSTEQAVQDFAVGFVGDLAGGGLGDLTSKYGSKAVARGLTKLPGFDAGQIRKLTGYDIIGDYADNLANSLGGSVKKASGDGSTVTYGKYTVRMMYKGGERTNPYFRISKGNKGTIDASGNFNSDRGATHFEFTGDPTEQIQQIIKANENL